ncbi:hypothetical protein D3C87_1738290 [compost metagenome]
MVIANPRTAVPTYKVTAPDNERTAIPMTKKIREIRIIRSTPYLRPNFGTKGDNNANAISGTVVIRPAKVFEICTFSRIRLTNGPTEVRGARKFAAIKIIPTIMNQKVACLRMPVVDIASCFFNNCSDELIRVPPAF